MTKTARKAKVSNSQPEPQTETETAALEQASNVSNLKIRGKGERLSLIDNVAREANEVIAEKMRTLGQVRQSLAEASDLFSQGAKEEVKAKEVAAHAGLKLYQAQAFGILSKDEVSATLGDIFGWKEKKDGSPSKTPEGQGEAIRKRVVRLVQARDYVVEGEGGTFFSDLPEDEVSQVLAEVDQGDLTIWQAYERFADIKRESTDRLPTAFNPASIAKLAEQIAQGGADRMIADSNLIVAYKALRDAINLADQTAAEMIDEVQAVAV